MKRHPTLVEYLSCSAWDDGSERERSTLSVFIEEGRVKVCLNDREFERSLYASGDTLAGVLAALEKALAADACEWRMWKGKGKKK